MESDKKVELVIDFCQSVNELKYRLRKMFQLKLKEANINISFEVLEVMKVLQHEGINQQEIADLLFKDKSSMTYLIDNMVKAGLVIRKEDEADRRNKLILLTDKARELQNQLKPLAMHCYLTIAQGITDPGIKAGIEMLAKMNNSLAEGII
jgi:DNA-binding MarR family transcriptional regulator